MSYRHLTKCSARSITTADRLLQDALEDDIPKDEETREDFGFTRCRHSNEESHLFGLYRGLLYLDVSPVELDTWCQKDILASKIIETFSAVPEESRGGYFPWFLRNQHVLDRSTPRPSPHSLKATWLDEARALLDGEDRKRDPTKLEPPAKQYCFYFFAIALNSYFPRADSTVSDMWYDFGFAVCNNEDEEKGLGIIYNKLVGGNKQRNDYEKSLGFRFEYLPKTPSCSFEEFWRACQDGKLVQVFEKYGLDLYGSPQNVKAEQLREFLSFSPDQLRPSVWRLKHFLALDDNVPLSGFPHVETAIREYGFTPQLDARTKLTLKAFYRKLFEKADAREVHKARAQGGLLELAESTCKDIDSRVRDVLRNLNSELKD